MHGGLVDYVQDSDLEYSISFPIIIRFSNGKRITSGNTVYLYDAENELSALDLNYLAICEIISHHLKSVDRHLKINSISNKPVLLVRSEPQNGEVDLKGKTVDNKIHRSLGQLNQGLTALGEDDSEVWNSLERVGIAICNMRDDDISYFEENDRHKKTKHMTSEQWRRQLARFEKAHEEPAYNCDNVVGIILDVVVETVPTKADKVLLAPRVHTAPHTPPADLQQLPPGIPPRQLTITLLTVQIGSLIFVSPDNKLQAVDNRYVIESSFSDLDTFRLSLFLKICRRFITTTFTLYGFVAITQVNF